MNRNFYKILAAVVVAAGISFSFNVLADILPRKIGDEGLCTGLSWKDPDHFNEVASSADAIFIAKVKSIKSGLKERSIRVDILKAWKGVSVGKDKLLSSTLKKGAAPDQTFINRTYLVMAAGNPLVWQDCTAAINVTELSSEELANQVEVWSKWIGMEPVEAVNSKKRVRK